MLCVHCFSKYCFPNPKTEKGKTESSSSQSDSKADKKTILKEGDTVKIKPRALDIVWGNDSRYWRFPKGNEGPAELVEVCWLEVKGSVPMKDLKAGTYQLKFKVSMNSDAFGWIGCPVYVLARVGGRGKLIWNKAILSGRDDEPFFIPECNLTIELPAEATTDDDTIRFAIFEIWRGNWKGGLVIHEVVISPLSE